MIQMAPSLWGAEAFSVETTFERGTDIHVALIIDPERRGVLLGSSGSPTNILRFNVSSFPVFSESYKVLDPGDDNINSGTFYPGQGVAYFGLSTNPGQVLAVNTA